MSNVLKVFGQAEKAMAALRPMKGHLPPLHRSKLSWQPSAKEDPDFNDTMITNAVYGWRRDYGEWPTWANVVDRLAQRMNITHGQAAARLAFASTTRPARIVFTASTRTTLPGLQGSPKT